MGIRTARLLCRTVPIRIRSEWGDSMMYRGVIYYANSVHIYYLEASDKESALDWLNDRAENMGASLGTEMNFNETNKIYSYYVPFVMDDDSVRQIWFDCYEDALDYSQFIGSEPKYGEIKPIVVDPDQSVLVCGKSR